jgi:L-alanine-DL-glutamate epimerase-like enolase superfamily enzyme
MKITRIRSYEPPTPEGERFRQTSIIVTVETDQGIVGIGEGGMKDTIELFAPMLIGEDPNRIEHLWQLTFRGLFSPPGRERLRAIGAIDMALWDIKGKALGVPVYELLGGATRNYLECYSTGFPRQGSLRETVRACLEAGFRVYRTGAIGDTRDGGFDARQSVEQTYEHCREIRDAVGKSGEWAIDYHARYDMADAVALSTLIEPLRPFFVEDLVRSENPAVYRTLRTQVKVPIAVGEQYGDRWDFNELIEQHLINYSRGRLPHCGGITEFMKMAALCETHYIGLVPHFSGLVATAAMVHCCLAFPGPVLMEMRGAGLPDAPHLPEYLEFRNGKMWPRLRPGLGVEFDAKRTQLISDITQRFVPLPILRRPDGSMTNW